MTFGIVQYSPTGFGLDDFVVADGCHGRLEIRNLKEKDSFVFRRVGLRALGLQANETCATVELGVVSDLLVGKFEAESFEVELSGLFQIVEVEFNTDEPWLDFLH